MNQLLNCSKLPPLSRHIVFMNANNVPLINYPRSWCVLAQMMLTKFRKILPSPTVPEVFKNQIKMLLPFRQLCGCGTWNRILGLWNGTEQPSSNAWGRWDWFFEFFIDVSQGSRVKYSFDFHQNCLKLFISHSCISEGLLEAALNWAHHPFEEPTPPRGLRDIELPHNTMLTEERF